VCLLLLPPCSSLLHNFKNAFSSRSPSVSHGHSQGSRSPSPIEAAPAATTHIKLHLESMLQQDATADAMEIDTPPRAAEEAGSNSSNSPAWPPAGTHLGDLPNLLVS
jgi:hypothetical protein